MTQQTRTIIANVFRVLSLLFIVAFIAEHFMTAPPRPSWHTDLGWVGIAFGMLSRIVGGQSLWRRMRA